MGHGPHDRDVYRFANAKVDEIENEVKSEISSRMAWVISALLSSGRINGNTTNILQRIENETIKILREHWVK
ncbi:MAG: hypothetical protein ACTSW7_01575 [Candidatus Thorarchaeota archaeon]|nr:hypothetical protein [Thermoplasmatales archaeon]